MTVLKGIPRILNPRLLHVLASMGHGDELVRAFSSAYGVCVPGSMHTHNQSASS